MTDLEMETFKTNVKKWLHLDDKMSELQQKIKAYRQQQKELTPIIIHFKNRASLSNKKLQTTIGTYFNDDDKAKDLIDHIMNNREIKETIKLKRYG